MYLSVIEVATLVIVSGLFGWSAAVLFHTPRNVLRDLPAPERVEIPIPCRQCDDPELRSLVAIAVPIVQAVEGEQDAGEWKYHQAYAKMLRTTLVSMLSGDSRWKIGLAIHYALAEIRGER